jgi:proteic killer suppression protein
MGDIRNVLWQKSVSKQLERLPAHTARKFYAWVTAVKLAGLRSERTSSGFHDEPLKGTRLGQRSIWLSCEYRANYVERRDGTIEFLEVIEVNKHEY